MPNTQKLVSDAREVISDSEKLMEATVDKVSDKAKEARNEIGSRFTEAKSKLAHLSEDLKEQAEEALKQTDKVIRNNPYQSLGIAFAVGALLGVVLNRR